MVVLTNCIQLHDNYDHYSVCVTRNMSIIVFGWNIICMQNSMGQNSHLLKIHSIIIMFIRHLYCIVQK